MAKLNDGKMEKLIMYLSRSRNPDQDINQDQFENLTDWCLPEDLSLHNNFLDTLVTDRQTDRQTDRLTESVTLSATCLGRDKINSKLMLPLAARQSVQMCAKQ